jgi:PPOX class probable F420-dependent enzyme
MSIDTIPQGDLRLLDDPTSQDLLRSAIPARLGYLALDGTPRVTPMWFTWNGTELILGAAGASPKVSALRAYPRVAVTIDTNALPYKTLTIRGDATVTIVDGAVDEYAEAALRYMGPEQGARFREYAKSTMQGMARVAITPNWVSLIDFQTRPPRNY